MLAVGFNAPRPRLARRARAVLIGGVATVTTVIAATVGTGPSSAAPVPPPAPSVLFSDGFETGNLSQWTTPSTTNPVNAGLAVQQVDVAAGVWAARSQVTTTTSGGSSALHGILPTQSDLVASVKFKALSTTARKVSVNLLRFRNDQPNSAPIATIGLTTTNKLVLTTVTPPTGTSTTGTSTSVTSTQVAAPDAWHTLQLHVNVTGQATEVSLDGVPLSELSLTGRDLGANPIAKIELGDPGSANPLTVKTWDIAFDDVSYSLPTDVTKPTAPAGLTATPVAGQNRINLAWQAATDNVGVTGYRVYRDNVRQATLSASTLSHPDLTVSPGTSYTYRVTALDAAGNESDPSIPVTASLTPPGGGTGGGTGGGAGALSTPVGVIAAAAGDSSIKVSWASTAGATGYDVYRDGATTPTGSTAGPGFVDTGLTGGSSHSYRVRAHDGAGHTSGLSLPAATRTWVFADGFSSGLSRWDRTSGLTVRVVRGNPAAVAPRTSSRAPRYAVHTLPGSYRTLSYQTRFQITGTPRSAADVLRLRSTSGRNLLAVYYTSTRRLAVHNDLHPGSLVSSKAVAVNRWQTVRVTATVAGRSSHVKVWLNGRVISALNRTTNLGSAPVGTVIAGESTRGRLTGFVLDDVRVTAP